MVGGFKPREINIYCRGMHRYTVADMMTLLDVAYILFVQRIHIIEATMLSNEKVLQRHSICI